jgi:hypothetical protein
MWSNKNKVALTMPKGWFYEGQNKAQNFSLFGVGLNFGRDFNVVGFYFSGDTGNFFIQCGKVGSSGAGA